MESSRIDVVVPAAGVGKRMRLNIPKQYALLSNKTVLEHTVYALLNCPYVGNVIVGVSDEDEYFNLLFTYIISLKEENAKLIDKLNEFGI